MAMLHVSDHFLSISFPSSFSTQVGRSPDVLVWNTRAECAEGRAGILNTQKATIATLTGHERKVSLSKSMSPPGVRTEVTADLGMEI